MNALIGIIFLIALLGVVFVYPMHFIALSVFGKARR